MYSTIGSPNAAVLPVPGLRLSDHVAPASSGGIACSWIGLGDS